jgi:hypothetical protein
MPSSLVFAPAWLAVAAHMQAAQCSRSVIRDGGFFGSSHVDSPRSAEAAADKVPRRLGLGRQTLDILIT